MTTSCSPGPANVEGARAGLVKLPERRPFGGGASKHCQRKSPGRIGKPSRYFFKPNFEPLKVFCFSVGIVFAFCALKY